MPKAILEYNLPEESEEYQDAMAGARRAIVLDEIDNKLRHMIKYEDLEVVEIAEFRKFVNELREEYDC